MKKYKNRKYKTNNPETYLEVVTIVRQKIANNNFFSKKKQIDNKRKQKIMLSRKAKELYKQTLERK